MSDTRSRTELQGSGAESVVDASLRQGFARIEQLVATEALSALRHDYDAILHREIDAPGDRYLGGLIRQVMNPGQVSDVFRDNPALHSAKEVARQIFQGRKPKLLFYILIEKGSGCQSSSLDRGARTTR